MTPGTVCVFTYPRHYTFFPEHRAHSGERVTIVRELVDGKDYDNPATVDVDGESDLMYTVRAADGWEGHAWQSELAVAE